MIELVSVTKRYGRGFRRSVTALDSIDLQLEGGTTVAVVGSNGAGKSTLFGILAGLVRPDSGSVRIAGRTPLDRIRTDGIGYLPDRIRFAERRSVAEVLTRLGILDGCPIRELSSRVDHALGATGLREWRNSRCGSLSRGMRQRLGLAQLLLKPRSVLLLDEPLAGLDPLWRARFRDLVSRLRAGDPDMTVLISSHELGEVARIADRVAVIQAGRLAATVEVDEDSTAMERRVLGILRRDGVE
jgi:ABC-type multidrug transport system ATPase subunit